MQLSLCTEEGPRAADGLNGRTEVTSTLDNPRRGTRARFLADLQPKCAGTSSICREKMGHQEGAAAFRHVPPRRAGGWRRALDFPPCCQCCCCTAPVQREDGEGDPQSPHPISSCLGPRGAAGRGDRGSRHRGRWDSARAGLPTVQQEKPPRHLTGELRTLQRAAAMRDSPLKVDGMVCNVGLSWPHGCLVAMVFSSSSYKGCHHRGRSSGGVGSWSGLLLSQGRRWLNQGTVLSPGASLGITVCGRSPT